MNRSVTLRRNAEYAGLHGAYWMVYCVAVSYAGVYLLAKNYSNSGVGAVMAAGYLLSIVLQPLVAGAADRSRRAGPLRFLLLSALAVALSVAGLLVFRERSAGLTICFVAFIAAELVLQPLVNAYAFYLERMETPIAFGIARAFGSLAYAALSVFLGWLVTRRGVGVLPVSALLCLGILFALLFAFRFEGPAPRPTETKTSEALTLRSLAARYRGFLFLMISTALLFFGHSLINNFIIQVVRNVGGTSAQMGTLCSVAALLELPAMLLFDALRRKFTCAQMLRFAAVFFFLKSVCVLLSRSVTALFFAQSLQAVSFAVLIPASIRYADETMAPGDANKAQALLTATITAGNIFSSAAGGVLIDRIAVRGMLTVGVFVSLLGALTMLFGMREPKKAVKKSSPRT